MLRLLRSKVTFYLISTKNHNQFLFKQLWPTENLAISTGKVVSLQLLEVSYKDNIAKWFNLSGININILTIFLKLMNYPYIGTKVFLIMKSQ